MKRTRLLTAGLATVAAAVVLAGCSGGDMGNMPGHQPPPSTAPPNGTTSPAPHNDADVAFAQGMIPHHSQAVEMSGMAAERAGSQKVKELAKQIEAAQGPEIQTMTGWLQSWGVPAPQPSMPGMDHGNMGHGDMGGDGMMSAEEMQQLQTATGADFDRLFLSMMIKHHEGAIAMAQAELGNGQYPPAKELAQQIVDAQKAEIDTMKGLLPPG